VFTSTLNAGVAALHLYLRPLLHGADPCPHRPGRWSASPEAALKMALFDVLGQAASLPVRALPR